MDINSFRPSTYNVGNWYWFMEDDTSQVWSSASASFVPTTNDDYKTWTEVHITNKMSWASLFNKMMEFNKSAAITICKEHQDKLKPEQVVTALLLAGVDIVSTATPELNGNYTIDVSKLTAIAAGLASGKGFPQGVTTISWYDTSGTAHAFNEADFLNFASAIENYVYGIYMTEAALNAGHTVTWPTSPLTID